MKNLAIHSEKKKNKNKYECSFTRPDFEAVKGFWISDVDGDGCDDILLL